MSYQFDLHDPATNDVIDATPELWSKLYDALGRECRLHMFSVGITYNFTRIIDPVFDKIMQELHVDTAGLIYAQWFSLRTAESTIPILEKMIDQLADDSSINMYLATEGNCKECLKMLLVLAKLRPDGIWRVW